MKRSNWTNGLDLLAKNDAAEVYGGMTVGGQPSALGFSGRRQNPDFKFKFKTTEERDTYVREYLDSMSKRDAAKLARDADKKAKQKSDADELAAKLTPGTILATNWGYEQTNVDFWQVIARSGRRISLRRLNQTTTDDGAMSMSGKTKPIPNSFSDRHDPVTIVIRSERLRINDHYAQITNPDESHQCSWYA